PGPNSPTIIRLGAERWPEGPKVQGINNGVVKIILYLDNKGNYLKNGKVNYELVSEEPPNRGFLGALLQMIRDGYYRSPVEYGIPLGCKCTLTYIWCKGKDCKSGVTIVSGNIIASIDH
ncbi:MAG: hypothetical protein NTV06_05955, partial [candidate division Zixibacteria bacterium]|nr:hypothetical protein [candidate division Zixibacteria bacterium]